MPSSADCSRPTCRSERRADWQADDIRDFRASFQVVPASARLDKYIVEDLNLNDLRGVKSHELTA